MANHSINSCPFCGRGGAECQSGSGQFAGHEWHAQVVCLKCGAQGPHAFGDDHLATIDAAIMRWNRVLPSQRTLLPIERDILKRAYEAWRQSPEGQQGLIHASGISTTGIRADDSGERAAMRIMMRGGWMVMRGDDEGFITVHGIGKAQGGAVDEDEADHHL